MFHFYSILDHFYVIINDLYAIVFHYYSITSIYIPNFSFVFYITLFVLYNRDLYSIFSYFVFNLCSLLFYKRVFIFDVLYLYSIVKAQHNLHNDMCAAS